jgi:hypothetical protein
MSFDVDVGLVSDSGNGWRRILYSFATALRGESDQDAQQHIHDDSRHMNVSNAILHATR